MNSTVADEKKEKGLLILAVPKFVWSMNSQLFLGIFGIDIGGTLSKIVYFERKQCCKDEESLPTDGGKPSLQRSRSFDHYDSPAHQAALEELYLAMESEKVMGKTGNRDRALSFYSSILGGRFHFLRFETRMMDTLIQRLQSTDIITNIKTIGCTGGGAHKYGQIIQDLLEIDILKFDELQCLIRGMHFVLMNYANECYTYRLTYLYCQIYLPLIYSDYSFKISLIL
jgi:type II pantothenate kinase